MESKYIDILHRHDLKVTTVRIQVLKTLMDSSSAMSHQALSAALSDENLDKVTLYRTLSAFTEKGILHKIATEDRNWLYAISPDVDAGGHAHFVCDVCEKVFCFPVPHMVNPVALPKPGFQVKTQEILLHGHCPTCHE
jgi:Fur family ferric uptake transcriptional regulator